MSEKKKPYLVLSSPADGHAKDCRLALAVTP